MSWTELLEKGLRAARLAGSVAILSLSVAACTASSDASHSLSFDSRSEKAIVVFGTSVNLPQREGVGSGRSLSTFWQEYDPDSDRLVPGGRTFVTTVIASPFSAEPAYLTPTISVLEVNPGAYALIGAGFPHLASTFVASKRNSALVENMGKLETWTHTVDPRMHIDPAAEVDRRRNFLFTVLPGEILYIGHFEFLKWDFSDSLRSLNYFQDEAAARRALADYPGISGLMVTFDPKKPPQQVSR